MTSPRRRTASPEAPAREAAAPREDEAPLEDDLPVDEEPLADEPLSDEDREALAEYDDRERDIRRRLREAEEDLRAQRRGLAELARRVAGDELPEDLLAEVEFGLVWASWRTGHTSAGELAEHFTAEHPRSGDLLALAWMIRGEVAQQQQLPRESLQAFRFGMNRLGEPLYAYALWRSASVQRQSGNDVAARESLLSVEREACGREAPELVRQLAYEAAHDLGHDVRVDPDGVIRPDTCPLLAEIEEEPEGWQPEE